MIKTFLCALLVCSATLLAQGQGPGRELFVADYSSGKVCLLDKEGNIVWEHKAPSCNEIWMLPSGNMLFTTGKGVLEVTREKKVVFEYKSASEIYACQRLPNGNTFVGECNAGRLLEVSPDGKVVHETRILPEGKDGGHAYIRNCRALPNGNYLAAHYGLGVVREYDRTGKVVMEIKSPSGPHSTFRLANGNTVIAEGDKVKKEFDVDGKKVKLPDARVFEVDKDGKTVWEVSNADLPGAPLRFMTGLQRLPNGNTLMSNWLGHGNLGKAPHLFEVTPDKKVVWSYANHKDFKTISSVQDLSVKGDATKFEIQH